MRLPVAAVAAAALAVSMIGLSSGVAAQASASTPHGTVTTTGGFVALPPTRLLDTRIGTGAPMGAVPAHGTLTVQVSGQAGVPASDVSAVVVNVTATDPTTGGYLTSYPAGATRPISSDLNFAAGGTVANLATVPLGAGGQISLYNGSAGTVQLVADVDGYIVAGGSATAAGAFVPVGPDRLLDTRVGTGAPKAAVKPRSALAVALTGEAGVPSSGVSAVLLNVTATQAGRSGFLSVYSSGTVRSTSSSLNFVAGRTVANTVTVQPGPDGRIDLYNGSDATVELVADVQGYYIGGMPSAAGTFVPVDPVRILDTRDGIGAPDIAVKARVALPVQVAGVGGVPASGAGAVLANLTITKPTAKGYLTAYADATTQPAASTLDFAAGQTVPNQAVVSIGSDGKIDLYNASGGTVQMIADMAGYYLASDRTVGGEWSWGDNEAGALGNGTTHDSDIPGHIDGLTDVKQIAGGAYFGFALRTDGTVWEWGQTEFVNPPDPPRPTTKVPVQVPGLAGVVAVSGQGLTAYALKSDGTVWAWGDNTWGQLGDGTQNSSDTPVQVHGLTDVTAISGGGMDALAIRSDGTLWAWGDNGFGELGIGSTADPVLVPVQITALSHVAMAKAGVDAGYAVLADGSVWSWGYNEQGQLGTGSSVSRSLVPVRVTGVSNVVDIAAGSSSAYVIESGGTLMSWGWNQNGQLGIGSLIDSHTPVRVSGISHVTAVTAYGLNTEAVTSDGTMWAWGSDVYGQLGVGASQELEAPARVDGLGDVTGIAAGEDVGYALVGP